MKFCKSATVILLLLLSAPALSEEVLLPPGTPAEKLNSAKYVFGQLIVKLKEGKAAADLQELNSRYKVSSMGRVFEDTPKPEEALSRLKADWDKLNAEHQSWYWQLDKDSREYKDYQQKIAKEKESLQGKIKKQEELIVRLERRQKRAPNNGQAPSGLESIYLLKTPDADIDISQMTADYRESPAVEYAEPNYIAQVAMTPNDPKYSQQWAHQKTEAESGWDITTGSSEVIIAIIDTGVDYKHEDLKANIWKDADGNPGKDFVSVDNDPSDDHGHGTHVAGIAAAKGNNNLGVAGVCYDCKIMPVRACYRQGNDGLCTDSAVGHAINYAVYNGADVINMSLGGAYSETIKTAIDYAYSKGAVLVAAAGNDASEGKGYPAALDNVIAVAATAKDDTLSSYSSFGNWVDFSAPGGDKSKGIISTLPKTGVLSNSSGYGSLQGTSMASPYVAGLAGLVITQHPAYTQSEIKAKIASGADNIDSLNSEYEGKLGYGRVNIYNSLNSTGAEKPWFDIESATVREENGDNDGIVEYNEEAELVVKIKNALANASSVSGTLSSQDSSVSLTDSASDYGEIDQEQEKDNSSDSFKFKITSSFIGAKMIKFTLTLNAESGFRQVLSFRVVVGIRRLNTQNGAAEADVQPRIYGDKVVWVQKVNNEYHIKLFDLKTNQEKDISIAETGSLDHWSPFIYGNKIVFFANRGISLYRGEDNAQWPIYLYDLESGQVTLIANFTNGRRSFLSLYKDKILWLKQSQDDNFARSIHVYDINTQEDKVITSDTAKSGPVIFGNKVVWVEKENDNYKTWEMYLYDLSHNEKKKIQPDDNGASEPRIYGNKVAYFSQDSRGQRDVYLYDLDTAETKKIISKNELPQDVSIYGNNIVYTNSENSQNIYLYNLKTEEKKAITADDMDDNNASNSNAVISGNRVVWLRKYYDESNEMADVYLTDIANGSQESFLSSPEVSDAGEYTVKTDQLYASWTDDDPDISEYHYAIGTSKGGTDALGWTTSSTNTSVTRTGLSLSGGSTYYFSVKAKNSEEIWSAEGYSDGITVDGSAPEVIIASPKANYISSTATVNVSGTASDNISGIKEVAWKTDKGGSGIARGTIAWSITALNLSQGKNAITVTAKDNAGNAKSVILNVTYDNTVLPAAPDHLKRNNVTKTRISLSWSDNSSNEDGFEIERKVNNTKYVEIAKTSANITQYTDTGLKAGRKYSYRVRACNSAGNSGYSDPLELTTKK